MPIYITLWCEILLSCFLGNIKHKTFEKVINTALFNVVNI